MKTLTHPRTMLFAAPEELAVHLLKKPAASVCLIADPALWEKGLLTGVLNVLQRQSVPVEMRADRPERADFCLAVGGHRELACLPDKGRCGYLPLPGTEELAWLHWLAHGVESALCPRLTPSARDEAAEACAMIIRALRDGGASEPDAWAEVSAAAAQIAKHPRGMQGMSHILATALGSAHAPEVSREDALYGAAHEAATLAALPVALAHQGDKPRRQLSFIAQLAGLASQGAGDDVASAALLTWLKERCAALQLPVRYNHVPRRDVWGLAQQVEKAGACDRFTAEKLLLSLLTPEDRETDAARLVARQRAYFLNDATLPLQARRDALLRLQRAIRAREHDIHVALHSDLGKCADEAYLCETGMVLAELRHMLAHLTRYARQAAVPTPLHQFPARSFTLKRPCGVTLIMSPWNYPFLLTMDPLIGAIAAGNTCIVKPSAYAPATSALLREIITECFPQEHAAVIEGGREQNQALLEQHFDKIFFTGSEAVGRLVLEKAAAHLTPAVLELGGKSPVVVDRTADVPLAARRIAFGKLLNAGQTCVAPDYVLVHRDVHNQLVDALKAELVAMSGENALDNADFPHMISEKHYRRVMGLIDHTKVVCGGRGDLATLRIQPTILDGAVPQDAVMQEEIFGPLLPILTVEDMEEAVRFIRQRPTPLACYLFTKDRAFKADFLARVPFGGGCVNDTIIHLASSRLPFGGLGASGMGRYHGRHSFDCFSHTAGVVDKSTLIDLPMRYAPYQPRWMRLIRFFLR